MRSRHPPPAPPSAAAGSGASAEVYGTNINDDGGNFSKGEIIAELDIKSDLWFFDCHFKNDPVMPGCLGLDAMWQLVGFFLGWLGEHGKGRALGVNYVKFTGEILKQAKKAINKNPFKQKSGPI